LAARVKTIERNAGNAVAQIWACSHNDARLMESLYETATPIHVVPNGVDIDYYGQRRAVGHRASLEKTIIFPAMFAYPPNRLGAVFLLEEIFPLLAEAHPDCRLMLPGSWPTVQMMEAARRDPRISVPGPVKDMRPHFTAASAMIVPLFEGSGTRLKILEAFASGVPVVSTPKGADGLEVENGKHLLLAETAPEFVDCLSRLWKNERLAADLRKSAFKLARRHYSWEAATESIRLALDALQQ
jgi:glycosyltransferase involved in cell wall biosynthesis